VKRIHILTKHTRFIWQFLTSRFLYHTCYFSTPAAGYYNDDDVPDFLIKNAFGPGFPVYYHSEVILY